MAERSGLRRVSGRIGTAPASSFGDEFYGRRMKLLMQAGAGKFLDTAPQTLTTLARAPMSDDDMLDQFLRAHNQAEFNTMRQTFEAMPETLQVAEFQRLPQATQEVLTSGGYRPPDEEQKALWKRILTWDIPLLPEEHMGKAIAIGATPLRAMGFFLGKAAGAIWEGGVMKPSRFATRLGRTGAYMKDMTDPTKWREAWHETEIEENSYYAGTLRQANDIVGSRQTNLLRIYLGSGHQAVWDELAAEAKANGIPEERVDQIWRNWQSRLNDEDNTRAIEVLESGKLTLMDASVRAWNYASPWDVRPDSVSGKAIGMVGALAVEILLDPMTWFGGFYVKIARKARAGIRAGQQKDHVNLWRRVTMSLRGEDAAGPLADRFKPLLISDGQGGVVDARDEVVEWIQGSWANKMAGMPFVMRTQGYAQIRFIDRVNDAFRKHDEIEEFADIFRRSNPDGDLKAAITEEFGRGYTDGIEQLQRDFPAMAPVLGEMRLWHQFRRRLSLTVNADDIDANGMWKVFDEKGELLATAKIKGGTHEALEQGDNVFSKDGIRVTMEDGEVLEFHSRGFPTLADEAGYWEFLDSKTGWQAIADLGGKSPEGIYLPKIGILGKNWVRHKQWIRRKLDFDNLDSEVTADLGRLFALQISGQTARTTARIWDDIQEGAIELSAVIDEVALREIMDDPTNLSYQKWGLGAEDMEKIHEARTLHEEQAYLEVLDDGELSPLLNWYQGRGYKVVEVDGKKQVQLGPKAALPFRGARRSYESHIKYYEGQIHPPGSVNDELTSLQRAGIITRSAAHALMYYPLRFAEKLTTYVPRGTHLDVTDEKMALSEFQKLIDMGVMSDISRTQLDEYLRAFTYGNEAERWRVTTEFYLDFLGRSGALLHGGADVQKFISKFIRHGHHRYGNITSDTVGLNGLNIHRAIIPSTEHAAQIARSNIIPNYRELAAVSRYMAFYRALGWGLHLPTIDGLIAKTWRPAVLLRLGYVVRNGGEELFSWLWREGPLNYTKTKIARSSVDIHPVWDKYGKKIMVKGADVPDSERLPLIWKPFSRLWRSFNEVAGVGDLAITRDAMEKAVRDNPGKWPGMTEGERFETFLSTRAALAKQRGRTVMGRTSRRMFEFANARANELSLLSHDVLHKIPGMPTREKVMDLLLRRVDKNHKERVDAIMEGLVHPTLLDAHMKDILGAFDNYLGFNNNTLDAALRQGGQPHTMEQLVNLSMDMTNTELAYISTEPGSEMYGVTKAVAMAQRLSQHSDDPMMQAAAKELIHYVTPIQSKLLRGFSDRFMEANPGLALRFGDDATPEQIVKILLGDHPDQLENLRYAFDGSVSGASFDEAGELIVESRAIEAGWPEAVDEFLDSLRVPDLLTGELHDTRYVSIWEDILDPRIDGQRIGQDVNLVGLLLNEADPLRLTTDLNEAVHRAHLAYVNRGMTPDGQKMVLSMHRSAVGYPQVGDIKLPLPDGATYLFVPMVPIELRGALAEMVSGGGGIRHQWFNDFVDELAVKFRELGIPEGDATKVGRMLQPSLSAHPTQRTASSVVAMADMWQEIGEGYFPIVIGSANDKVATAVSQVLEDMLARRMGGRIPFGGPMRPASTGRIGSITVNSEELWNAPGLSQGGRPADLDVTVIRNNVGSTTQHERLAEGLGGEYMNTWYGWGERGATSARDFGPDGLRHENVIGISGSHLLTPRPGGLSPVPMLDNVPTTYRTAIWEHANGQSFILREGAEQTPQAIADNYKIVAEQIIPGNDMTALVEEVAMINLHEFVDLVGAGSRTDYDELFQPWIREVLNPREVSADRIHAHAERARWWDKAPNNILAFIPVTNEGGSVGEKIGKAWTTILRNWFDGVVNPMIGAMVREPMFQHYLFVSFGQTEGIRRLYHRPKVKTRIERGQLVEKPFNWKLHEKSGLKLGYIDDNGQFAIDELEGFIRHDWPLRQADPSADSSILASAIEIESPAGVVLAIDPMLDDMEIAADVRDALKKISNFMRREGVEVQKRQGEFFTWLKGQKRMVDAHRDVAVRRAMHLTSAYIDDHRIRSQFQAMVGTIVPFWFAEDNFLRRVGRSLAHNPLMLRNLHLTMNAGVYGGLIQEDQFGGQRIVIPGSEVATHYMLEIADNTPIVNSIFGGDLGSVQRPSQGIALNIKVIPGYDVEQIGRPGFGPLLAAPINFASGRDPELRKMFEKNLVGGRFTAVSKLDTGMGSKAARMSEAVWSSVVPALIARAVGLAGIDGPNGEARAKAKIDIIKFLAMTGQIPDEVEIASQSNPALFSEAFLEEVDMMAKQYQLLQALTWFFGPNTGSLADLVLHENWEWNNEFHELLEMGMSFEEAYPSWMEMVEARTGKKFDPVEHSPFRTPAYQKIPFAVLETTQEANRWLVGNDDFTRSFRMSAPFFMPRKFDVEDDEYVAEAKQRQINMGLRKLNTPEEFLEELYFNISYPVFHKVRTSHLTRKNIMKANRMDTTELDRNWDAWYESFKQQHPVFVNQITTGTARLKRDQTIHEFRLLVESPDLVPEGLHRDEILNAMATIVGFADKMEAVSGMADPDVQKYRDALRFYYMRTMETYVYNKPWLNELYYSMFLPLVGESWIAKHDAGLINIDLGVLA